MNVSEVKQKLVQGFLRIVVKPIVLGVAYVAKAYKFVTEKYRELCIKLHGKLNE